MPKVTKQTAKPGRKKKGKSAIDRIEPLSAMEDEGIKLNLYGRSATGKTTFWATFPKPILAIVCSGSIKPGELRSINTPEYRKSIKQVIVEKTSEIVELADYCQENPNKFKTIVLDHASGLQEYVLKELLNMDEAPVQLSWGVASQQQWGQVAMQMKGLLRKLLNLSQNVVIVAQEREFNTDSDSSLLMPCVGSALTPSVTGWLNPTCDYICQTMLMQKTEEKEVKIGKKKIKTRKAVAGVDYCLRTGPSAVYTTKFRVPKGKELPDMIMDPDFDKFMAIINSRS